MPKLLTIRKQKWANKFKPDILRGSALNPNASVEARYYASIAWLIDKMAEDVSKQINRLFDTEHAEEFFAQDKSISSQAKILTNALKKKWETLFADRSQPIAEAMVTQSDKTASSTVYESTKQLSGGLSLPVAALTGPDKEIIKASTTANAQLIKSIPEQYLNGVQLAVMRSITTGRGLKDLVPYLAKNKGVTLRRARFIAKDQTKKVFEDLARARCENVGIKKGEWLHTGGSNHPRKTHIEMTGKIFDLNKGLYDSAIKRYTVPGEQPGCRCRFIPVIEFKD